MIKPLSKVLPDCAKGFLSLCVRVCVYGGGGAVHARKCVYLPVHVLCVYICVACWGSTYHCMCLCRVAVSSSDSLKLTFQIIVSLTEPGSHSWARHSALEICVCLPSHQHWGTGACHHAHLLFGSWEPNLSCSSYATSTFPAEPPSLLLFPHLPRLFLQIDVWLWMTLNFWSSHFTWVLGLQFTGLQPVS